MQTTPPQTSPAPTHRGWNPVPLILVILLVGLIICSIGTFLKSVGQLGLVPSLYPLTPTPYHTSTSSPTYTQTIYPSRTPETVYVPLFTPPSFHMTVNCFFNSNGVYVCQPLSIDTLPPTATPTNTATPTPSPTATFTPSPTVTFTPTATNTPTPTLLEGPVTQAGISLFSTLCFTGLLILLLVWMARQRVRRR